MSKPLFGLCGLLCLFLMFQSCREDLQDNLPVIKGELLGEYLDSHPERFSEFAKMLDTTGVMGLLNAYGLYTVFAPTNDAIERYYASLTDDQGNHSIHSMNQLSLAELKAFCYNHIIKGDTLLASDFSKGALGSQSMSGRFLTVSMTDTSSTIYINGKSPIIQRDVKLHNGYIHVLGEALAPARVKIGEVFEGDTLFSIYAAALRKTGLYDIMNLAPVEDVNFDPNADKRTLKTGSVNPELRPMSKKFGYTILAVSDKDLEAYTDPAAGLPNGIHSVADLEKLARYYYSRAYNNDADNITDPKNKKHYLNRFMSYHCFDRILLSSRFVKDLFTPHHYPQFPMPEYIETMLDNSLVEVLEDKQGNLIGSEKLNNTNSVFGVFNFDDPMQGAIMTTIKDKPSGGALNGFYHGIDKPIMYSRTLMSAFSSKRLRIDVATFLPELTTNNMRGSNPSGTNAKLHCYLMPPNYVEGMQCSANTRFTYLGNTNTWEDYQGDEFYMEGSYNFTVKTCPIPAGTYEVRMGYQATQYRGIAQLYFDSLPCGIPLNLSLLATSAGIGYETPGSNREDPDGYENDKMMHNRGYMKGASTYGAYDHSSGYNAETARLSDRCIRRVLGTYTFDKTEKHYFTVISLGTTSSSTEFMLDYLEFCPVELLETEGID